MTPESRADAVLAIDLGGTDIKAELVDRESTVLDTLRRPTPVDNRPDAVVARLLDVARELRASASAHAASVVGVGVAVPGIVSVTNGLAVYSANLGWRDLPLRDLLESGIGLPVSLEHDVTAAGRAECAVGAGRGVRDLVVVVIGTGISAVLVADGRVVRGGAGQAGELGHVVVRASGPRCPCGAIGCLEAVASARAIAAAYSARTGRPVDGAAAVRDRLGHDPDADAVWADAVSALADGLLTVTALVGPSRIVVGGGLAAAGDALLGPLAARLAERATLHVVPELVPAELGARAGRVGAAMAAWDMPQLREPK